MVPGTVPEELYLRLIEAQPLVDGRFSEIRRIGTNGGPGNFSLVFNAHDQVSEDKVALKFFNPLKVSDTYRYDSFFREAALLDKFKGQNDILEIVRGITPFDTEIHTELGPMPVQMVFHATKLGDSNLEHRIYNETVSLSKTLKYFRGCCRSVQRLHSSFVVHRDLKLDQWICFGVEDVRLADLGTARQLDGYYPPLRTQATYFEEIGFRGAVGYTAPELLFGSEGRPEAFYLGDFYSLGAILYEMLTNQGLGTYILSSKLLRELWEQSHLVPPDKIEKWSIQKSKELASKQPLPLLEPYSGPLPEGVAARLDRLYRGLACLDYTRRLHDFDAVFLRLEQCIRWLDKFE